MDNINDFLARHRRLSYWQRVVRRSRDLDFVQKVLEIDKDPFSVKIHRLGDRNPDKIILLYRGAMPTAGFGAQHRKALDVLAYADYFGFTPAIVYTPGYTYAEKEPVHGTDNGFEYYFAPPAAIGAREAAESAHVVFYQDWYDSVARSRNGDSPSYIPADAYIELAASMQKKYIRLNESVGPLVRREIEALLGNRRTLGVHVRGTDFAMNCTGHPVMVDGRDLLQSARKAMDTGLFEQIFLATDEAAAVERFERQFGKRLVYHRDAMRSAGGGVGVHFQQSGRKNHHYLLGLEILRDIYTLAACAGLVAGYSQVSFCARAVKLSGDERYAYVDLLDRGINRNRRHAVDLLTAQQKARGDS